MIVKPITTSEESDLRYDEWEYTRRQTVEQAGGGQIGYVHLRAMGGGDMDAVGARLLPGVRPRRG